ncbi:hypothetical protein AAFF27_19180 [Xylophilus sp. GW821-FHT01B05]
MRSTTSLLSLLLALAPAAALATADEDQVVALGKNRFWTATPYWPASGGLEHAKNAVFMRAARWCEMRGLLVASTRAVDTREPYRPSEKAVGTYEVFFACIGPDFPRENSVIPQAPALPGER